MWLNKLANIPGRLLAKFLTQPSSGYVPFAIVDTSKLSNQIQPCDVLLVEGDQRISSAIKYMTQSTWSHSAIYVGNIINPEENPDDPKVLIEADIKQGVIAVPLSKYARYNLRICRPVNVTSEDKARVISFIMRRLGNGYDLKNVFDLARYLFPTPPIPSRFRRRMIALGSGDPTRAICSSLIAQAFQSIQYPILPEISVDNLEARKTMMSIRHHSLFTPSDFDLSPYFKVIKPTLETGFNYKDFNWVEQLEVVENTTEPQPQPHPELE